MPGPKGHNNHSSYPDTPASILLDSEMGGERGGQVPEEEPEYLARSYDPNDPSDPLQNAHTSRTNGYTPEIERSSSDHSTGSHHGSKARRLTPAAPSPSSKYTTSTEGLTRSTMTSVSFSLPMMSIPHRSTMGTPASTNILGGQPPPSSFNCTDKQLSKLYKLYVSSKRASEQSTGSTASEDPEVSFSTSRLVTRNYTSLSTPDNCRQAQRTLVGLSKLNSSPIPPVPPLPDQTYMPTQTFQSVESAKAFSAALASRPTSTKDAPTRKPSDRKPPPPQPLPTLQLSREVIIPSFWVDEDAYDRFQAGQETTSVHMSDDSLSSRHASSHIGTIDYAPVQEAERVGPVDLAEAVRQVRFKVSKETFGHTPDASVASTRPESPRSIAGSFDSFMTATEGHGATPVAGPSRMLERSAVTPQLPPLNLEDGSKIHFGRIDEGEEKIMSMYEAKNN